MISLTSPVMWYFVFGTGFFAFVLYWARVAIVQGSGADSFLNPMRSVPSFTVIVTIGASGFVPFFTIGMADGVAQHGYGFAAVSLGSLLIPLAGVLVFKRAWAIAAKLETPSQASFMDEVFASKSLVVLCAVIGLLFAVAFGGRVMTMFALLYFDLTGGVFDPIYSLFLVAGMISVLAVVGGMRGVMFAGAIQGAIGFVTLLGLVGFTLYLAGGFDAMATRISEIQAQGPDVNRLFGVSGIVQFTQGAGFDQPAGSSWTAAMVLSTALAFVGLSASPVMFLFVISSRSNAIFGPGLTWVSAGVVSGLIVSVAMIVGSFGLINGNKDALFDVMSQLTILSPWFSALLYFGLLSLVVSFVSGSFFAAAQLWVVDVYRRYYHTGLSDEVSVAAVRILIVVLVIFSVLFSISAPVLTAQLSSLCLPLSVQLAPAMIASCYRIGISRSSIAVGALIGVFCVFLTEAFGIRALEFVGLELPWGQWPWTIHSAGWGLFFNVGAVLVISVITRFRDQGREWNELTQFLDTAFPETLFSRPVISTAWSVGLAWIFFAIGPGLFIGNELFVREVDRVPENMLGLPSIIIWILIAWATGVALNWFFAFRMQLATSVPTVLTSGPPHGRTLRANGSMNTDRLSTTVWILLAIGGCVASLAWIFG